MVKINKAMNIINIVISFVLILLLISCNDEESNLVPTEDGVSQEWYHAYLYFNPIFSNQESRASDEVQSYEPNDNDLLVLSFNKPEGQSIKGYARYDKTTQQWKLSYLGSLANCSNEKCQLVYIGNNPTFDESQRTASFSAESALFECKNGIYDFIGGDVSLYATLSPITSRVRFKGNKESEFEMRGFGTYNKFALSDWQFSQVYCLDAIPCNVSNSLEGYVSPCYYIYSQKYGNYGFTKCDNLWIKDGNSVYLWKKNTSKILTEGASGIINLPSIEANGWYSDTYRTRTISDITISAQTTGGWTQTQSQTRFYSKVGIQVNLTYTITSQGAQTFTSYPFAIGYWAYDDNGDYLGSWHNGVHKDDIKLNKDVDYHEEYYIEGASYYEIQFYELKVSAKISNFKISTF